MREKRRGYPPVVSIGYKKEKSKDKEIKIVRNLKDLEKVSKNQQVFIGKVGKKKKIEILKKAAEMKIQIKNVNVKKFLKKNSELKNKSSMENKTKSK